MIDYSTAFPHEIWAHEEIAMQAEMEAKDREIARLRTSYSMLEKVVESLKNENKKLRQMKGRRQ